MLTAEDCLEIQQLYAKCNHAVDFGDGAGWAATFTPDGVVTASAAGTFTGTEALTEFGTGFSQRVKGRHWTNNLVIEDAPGGASGKCYLALLLLGSGPEKPTSILTTGVYRDELVKGADGWRFKSRKVEVD